MSCLVDFVPSPSLSISWMSEPWLYLYGGFVSPSSMDMDLTSPPPVFTKQKDSYVVQLADGTHAAMSLDSYISPAGSKGMLTINIIYPY